MDLKKIMDKILGSKKILINLAILLLFGVLLILIGNISSNISNKSNNNTSDAIETSKTETYTNNSYENRINEQLSNILSEIKGVGKTSVMIYFNGSSKTVPAFNINDNDNKTEEKDTTGGKRSTIENSKNQNVVLISENGDSKPLIVKQTYPEIGGIMIVAEGADIPVVKERILDSVRIAFGLDFDKIAVMPMKNN